MEAIRIVLAVASMLLVMMMIIIISSASVELTEEASSPSPSSTPTAAASAPLHRSDFLFTMQFFIGGKPVSAIADTASGLIWTNNSGLLEALPVRCPSDNGGTTWRSCDGRCIFKQEYSGGDVIAVGLKGEAELTFDGTPVPNKLINIGSALILGCRSSSDDITAENKACKSYARGGIVGLNRDERSLVSQLQVRSFSYCLPHPEDKTTRPQIKFNYMAAVSHDGTKTPKIKFSDKASSKNYVVGLKQILVGGTSVKSFPADGSCLKKKDTDDGAMVIDSGASLTSLPVEVFNKVKSRVKELLKKQKNGEEPIDAPHKYGYSCYQGTCPDGMHSIELDFCSDEKKKDDEDRMEIPAKNYLFKDKDEGKDLCCLAFTGTRKRRSIILGAYQQQDMHMLFDIEKETVSFSKPSGCGQSQEENHATM